MNTAHGATMTATDYGAGFLEISEKGFGFLRYGDGESIFFHVTQCEEGADGIGPGTRVTFVVGHNAKKGKPQAEVVRRVG